MQVEKTNLSVMVRTPTSCRALGVVAALCLPLIAGCASLPISEEGIWEDDIQEPITVKEAATIERKGPGKGVAAFALTLIGGSRVGLEWNEGRRMRPAEIIRAIPLVGLTMVPFFCAETLREETMQERANKTGMDSRRMKKFDAIVKRLEMDGRETEAAYLKENTPFDPANHPPDPRAKIPKEDLDGIWNNIKIMYITAVIGDRTALERNEGRGLRKLELWHPLLLTRVWEAFEAGRGEKMSDIAEEKALDEAWLNRGPNAPDD